MPPDPVRLAGRISGETGVTFNGGEGSDGQGGRWLELRPAGVPLASGFVLRATLGWRRLEVAFRPGQFAGELLDAMAGAGGDGRAIFGAVLRECAADGAVVDFTVNGQRIATGLDAVWPEDWRTVSLTIVRGQVAIGAGEDAEEDRLVILWMSRLAAAVLSLMPLDQEDEVEPAAGAPEVAGLPEGARLQVVVNGYERSRRNRAAALAIHGYACHGCGLSMPELYGEVATGLIEVHHLTPVSKMGGSYVVDPVLDLVPLCPNCHAVAHRRDPPFTIEELRALLASVSRDA